MQDDVILKHLETLKFLCEQQHTLINHQKEIPNLSNTIGLWFLSSLGIFFIGGLIGLGLTNNTEQFLNSLGVSLQASIVISLVILLIAIFWRVGQEIANKLLYKRLQKKCMIDGAKTLNDYRIRLRQLIRKQEKVLLKEDYQIYRSFRKAQKNVPDYKPFENILYDLVEWLELPEDINTKEEPTNQSENDNLESLEIPILTDAIEPDELQMSY